MDRFPRRDSEEGFSALDREIFENPLVFAEAPIDFIDDQEEFDGEDFNDEPPDQFHDDVEADADVLASAGWGTNEDYGDFGYGGCHEE